MNNNTIKYIFFFILGGIVFGTLGVFAATTLASSTVSYDNKTSGGTSTTVQGAVDELYSTSAAGKTNIINALNNKGTSLTANSTYAQIVSGIGTLKTFNNTGGLDLANHQTKQFIGNNNAQSGYVVPPKGEYLVLFTIGSGQTYGSGEYIKISVENMDVTMIQSYVTGAYPDGLGLKNATAESPYIYIAENNPSAVYRHPNCNIMLFKANIKDDAKFITEFKYASSNQNLIEEIYYFNIN